jgi:autotransporter-associated beta strand protein
MKNTREIMKSTTALFFDLRVALGVLSISIFAASAHAATAYTWTNAATGNWSTTTAWSPNGTPGNGDSLTFATGQNINQTIYLDGNRQTNTTVVFTNTGTTTLLGGNSSTAGSNSLFFNGGVLVASGAGAVTIGDINASPTRAVGCYGGSQTITNNSSSTLTIANSLQSYGTGSTTTFTFDGTGNTTISGAVRNGGGSNVGALTKKGAGTLTLSGVNTYSGATVVGAGTVTVSSTGVINNGNTSGGNVTVTNSGILDISGTVKLNNNPPLSVGDNSTAGSVVVRSSGTLSLAGGSTGIGNGSSGGTTPSSTFTNYGTTTVSGTFYVGNYRVGTLDIEGGTMSSSSALVVGARGNATLTMNGGAASFSYVSMGFNLSGYTPNSTLNLNGGTLTVGSGGTGGAGILKNTQVGTTAINFGGGTLKSSAAMSISGGIAINLNSGGAIIDTTGGNITSASSFLAGTGTGNLTVQGSNTLTLPPGNSYTGTTTITNNSTLAVTSQNSATGAVTVSAGSTLAVTVSGVNQWSPASLTLGSGGLGATLTFSGITSTNTPPLNPGSVVTNGITTVNITSGTFALGNSYPLLANAVTNNSYSLGTQPPGVQGILGMDGSSNLVFTVTTISDIWNANTPGGNWDIATTANWTGNTVNNFPPNTYTNSDPVAFNDSVTGPNTVTVTADVTPSSIIVNNSSTAYTITNDGTHNIGGSGMLTKSGSTNLTLSGANTFTGGTTLTAGKTLLASDPVGSVGAITSSPIGTGTLTLSGGTLSSDSTTARSVLNPVQLSANTILGDTNNNGKLTFDAALNLGSAARTLTLNSDVQLNGSFTNPASVSAVTKNGTGTLTITANNSLVNFGSSLGFSINQGTVVAANTAALGTNGQIVSLYGGTLDLATDTSANAYVLNVGSSQTGTVLVDRATAGAGITHTMSVCTFGNSTVNVSAGANVTSGTATLALTKLNLTGGAAGTLLLNPTTAALSIGAVDNLANYTHNLQLDGTNTGNFITGVITNSVNTLALTKANSSTWTLSGANTYTGGTTVNAGTLALSGSGTLGSSPLTLAGGTLDLGGTTASSVGTVTISMAASSGDTIKNGSLTGTSFAGTLTTGNAIVSASLQGIGTPLTMSGVGGTLTLTGTNTYTGGTFVNVGAASGSTVLALNHDSSDGNPATIGNVSLNGYGSGGSSRAQLYLMNSNQLPSTATVAMDAKSSYCDLILGGNSQTVAIISTTSANPAVNACYIENSYNTLGSGAGILTLNNSTPVTFGSSAYVRDAGGTGSGTLAIALAGNSTVTAGTGSIINTGGWTLKSGALNLAGNIVSTVPFTLQGGTLESDSTTARNLAGNLNFTGNVTLGDATFNGALNLGTAGTGTATLSGSAVNRTLTVNSAVTINPAIGDGGNTNGLIKAGSATLTLIGANTYTGNTTINAGTLVISQATISTNSTVSVSNNAVLQLDFATTNRVGALVLNGVTQLGGIYNSNTAAPYITGPGALEVSSLVPSLPPNGTNLTFSVNNGQITLSWPSNYLGAYLQVQTNQLNRGLSTNWVTIQGSQTTNIFTLPLNATDPSVFFRMVHTNTP